MREIATIDLADGVQFDAQSLTTTVIRDGDPDEYAGIRVRVVGHLGRSRLTVGIDISFGDPIWPEPQVVELPRIAPLDREAIALLGYPLTMVLAEKIVTAIDRGEGNTRWRDFADVYTLVRLHAPNASALRQSMATVAEYRKVELHPLLPALAEMPDFAQAKWKAWRRRIGREKELPETFAEVLTAVAGFADPVIKKQIEGAWDPDAQSWS